MNEMDTRGAEYLEAKEALEQGRRLGLPEANLKMLEAVLEETTAALEPLVDSWEQSLHEYGVVLFGDSYRKHYEGYHPKRSVRQPAGTTNCSIM